MNRHLSAILISATLLVPGASAGPLRVVTAYPYIGDLAQRIGGSNVTVFALARGDYNPHVIIPRPSFIAQIRKADLLIINGGELEIGWIPPLLRQGNNPAVQVGEPGFLDLSHAVTLIDVPTSVSRELGDVHPEGNPHFCLDPENIPLLARAIKERLVQLDPGNTPDYEKRYREFTDLWAKKLAEWGEKMKPFANVRVMEYHKIFDYFLRRYKVAIAATVEPLPGIPPTSRQMEHLESLLAAAPARVILQDVYNPDDASRHLAERLRMKVIVLPHDVGSVPEADNIVSLFDTIVRRITE